MAGMVKVKDIFFMVQVSCIINKERDIVEICLDFSLHFFPGVI